MGKKMKERRVYTREFKAEAIALAKKGEKPVRQIAGDLGVNENVLYRWIQRLKAAANDRLPAFPGHGRPRDESDFSPHWSGCGKKTRRSGVRMKS